MQEDLEHIGHLKIAPSMAEQLIIDYFDNLDQTVKKPYIAYYDVVAGCVTWDGLLFHGLYVDGNSGVQCWDISISKWVYLCNLTYPESLEKIRTYVDKIRGQHGKI